MRTLAIDCATTACSVALFEGETLIDRSHQLLGRGHAEHLIPAIAGLRDSGRADRIAVSLGPGSFTGVRIGIAAARALGVAWRAEVLGYPTLRLIAVMAQGETPLGAVDVAMTGGHGQWFLQSFDADLMPVSELASLAPVDAARHAGYDNVAGDQAEALVALRGFGAASSILPDAAYVARIAADAFTTDLRPIYGRAPDARVPE